MIKQNKKKHQMFYFPQKTFLATLLEQKDQLAIPNLILLISFDFSYKSPVLFSCHSDFKKRPTSYIWDENTFDFQSRINVWK